MNGRKKNGIFLIAAACAVLLLTGSLIHVQNGKKAYAGRQVPIDTSNMDIDISRFWDKEISEDENTFMTDF